MSGHNRALRFEDITVFLGVGSLHYAKACTVRLDTGPTGSALRVVLLRM